MSTENREVPHRREMDIVGNVFKKYWKHISVAIFAIGVIWAHLQGQIMSHGKDIDQLKAANLECHDFMTRQGEVNKKIDMIDEKFDRLDRYIRRRP